MNFRRAFSFFFSHSSVGLASRHIPSNEMSKCSPHDEKQLRCQLNIQKAVKRGGTVAKWSKHYHSMKKAMRNLILIHLAACKALENQLAMKFSIKILRRSNQRRIITYLPTDTQFGLIHFSFIYNSSLHMHIF